MAPFTGVPRIILGNIWNLTLDILDQCIGLDSIHFGQIFSLVALLIGAANYGISKKKCHLTHSNHWISPMRC